MLCVCVGVSLGVAVFVIVWKDDPEFVAVGVPVWVAVCVNVVLGLAV